MRKEIQMKLVQERPHLYTPRVLRSVGLQPVIQNEFRQLLIKDVKRFQDNYFNCGEGWLPVIHAFAETLNQILNQQEEEQSAEVLISGVTKFNHRLNIIVDTNGNLSESCLTQIEVLREFSQTLSSWFCENCGTQVTSLRDGPARCIVCQCRESH